MTVELSRQEQIQNSDLLLNEFEANIQKYISEKTTITPDITSPFLTFDQVKSFASTIVSKALETKMHFERLWFSFDNNEVAQSFSVKNDASDTLGKFVRALRDLREFDEKHKNNILFTQNEISKKNQKYRHKKIVTYSLVALMFSFDLAIFWQMLFNKFQVFLSLISIFGTLVAIDGLPALAGSRLSASRNKSPYHFEDDKSSIQKRKNRRIEGIIYSVVALVFFITFCTYRVYYLKANISGDIPPQQWLSIIVPIATSLLSFAFTLNLYYPVGIAASERRIVLLESVKEHEPRLRACLINLKILQKFDPSVLYSSFENNTKKEDLYVQNVLEKLDNISEQQLGEIAYMTCQGFVKSLNKKVTSQLSLLKEESLPHCFSFDLLLETDLSTDAAGIKEINSMKKISKSIKMVFTDFDVSKITS